MKLKLIFLLSILFITSGCEYVYKYSYVVQNKTDAQLKVAVKTLYIDSTFIISKDSTKLLFMKTHGIESAGGPYFEDVKVDLLNFKVIKKDSIVSKRNYLKNDSWIFEKGKYSTIVTNDEFK